MAYRKKHRRKAERRLAAALLLYGADSEQVRRAARHIAMLTIVEDVR